MKGLFKNLNFREMGKRLWHALTGHLWLKLLSLLFAIILWIYIIDSTPSLTRSKHMSGLSISVTGTSSLNVYGLALATDVYSEYQGEISAVVEAPQNQLSRVTRGSIDVSLDVSNIRVEGTYDVPLLAESRFGTVTKLYPDSVTVHVESLDSRDMPIEVNLNGMDTEHYWYNVETDSVNPQQITVSGPMSVVQTVFGIRAQLDVSDQTASFRRSALVSLLDQSRETIPTSRLLKKSASTCAIKVDIYPKKDLSVVLDPSQLGVADGYEITSISFMPPTITVAAEPDLLEDLEHLPLKIPDKLKNASPTKSFTETLSFSNLSEFKYVSSKQVYMTVTISEIQDTNLLSDIPVKTFGLPDGLTATLSADRFSVQVTGPRSQVAELESDDVYAYVDLTGLSAGIYELPIVIGNNPELSYASLTPSTIKVTLEEAAVAAPENQTEE